MILINNDFKRVVQKSTYVALGSFDGIHKGHLALINKSIELSKNNDSLSMIYTFKNHPRTFINKEEAPKLISTLSEKIKILEDLKVDLSSFVEFDKKFMKLEPEEFIDNLIKNYNVKGIVVGFNYRFGHKNKGDVRLLKELCNLKGIELCVIEPFTYKSEVVSSTRIRKALSEGKLEDANNMLGRYFSLSGEVVSGKKIGRTIDFPTANLKTDEKRILPKIGVYYTNVGIDKKIYKGITSVGNNPTVNGKNITVETHILNFDEDIYGKNIKLYFISKIRNEKRFNSLEELKEQLIKDKNFAEKSNIKISL
ncbi:bifunctional riboflavin kinase/FAD synthetase [Clostridium sp. LIBA-8841]|uniref:bifunctional riboflavin kinase/FAD synthetase n=1 Tax=Clostridium sp. LIBA-8841 TaxID=2987530 RepID=UPI002AC7E220|nr:bifunctional riboflavin kinase/FAD synthetase [Clostridium sp. LIBA-8841]MDZ5252608.1 bifunctional riboflavin kinase/FAD synthetase [Clostridium sp. LIBA-8841]